MCTRARGILPRPTLSGGAGRGREERKKRESEGKDGEREENADRVQRKGGTAAHSATDWRCFAYSVGTERFIASASMQAKGKDKRSTTAGENLPVRFLTLALLFSTEADTAYF